MLSCIITGLSQDMSFEQDVTLTYLLLRLPDGSTLRAAVDQEAATQVLRVQAKNGGIPQPGVRVAPMVPPSPPADEDTPADDFTPAPSDPDPDSDIPVGAHVFGGQDMTPAVDSAPAEEPPDEPPPEVEKTKPRQRNSAQRGGGKYAAPSRTVPKDDRGYPIVPNAGIDTSQLTGERDPDEDGIGSV